MDEWLGAHWKDALDVVSVVATVVAAWLAWLAIRRGNAQAKKSAEALVRERRIDFELDQLDRLHSAVNRFPAYVTEATKKHLQLLPDPFPILRAAAGQPSTPEAEAAVQDARQQMPRGHPTSMLELHSGRLGDKAREEVENAIQQRLDERDEPE